MKPARPSSLRTRQQGLGVVAAIVVLVMLSSLAAAVVRLTWTQQLTAAQDVMGARAFQAANAGVEWGLFQALRGSWVGCTSNSQTLDLQASMGYLVTVSCSSRSPAFVEGGDATGAARSVRVYTIDAVACNGSTSCPDNTRATTLTYVERRRQTKVTDIETEQ